MSGLTLDVGIDGAEALIKRLNNLDLKPGLLRSLHKTLGEAAVTQTKERFRAQKRPDGGRWPKSRRARDKGGQTLSDRGDLKNSINKRATSRQVEVGTNKEYAAVHQFGFAGTVNIPAHQRIIHQAFGRKLKFPVAVNVKAHSIHQEMPARPFLGISAANEKELLAEIDNWLARRIAK